MSATARQPLRKSRTAKLACVFSVSSEILICSPNFVSKPDSPSLFVGPSCMIRANLQTRPLLGRSHVKFMANHSGKQRFVDGLNSDRQIAAKPSDGEFWPPSLDLTLVMHGSNWILHVPVGSAGPPSIGQLTQKTDRNAAGFAAGVTNAV
jgi:hypothetical protein